MYVVGFRSYLLFVKMRFLIYADILDVFIPTRKSIAHSSSDTIFHSLIIEIDLIVPAEKRHSKR